MDMLQIMENVCVVIQETFSESNTQYLKYSKQMNIKGHSARFPEGIPEFFIKYLTNENDFVVDIFSGSNTTGKVAEQLGRRWLAIELLNEYVASSVFRFSDDFESAQRYYNQILDGENIILNQQIANTENY